MTTETTTTKPLDIQFDVCYDDFSDEWEAVADLISQAGIPSQVVSINHNGQAPHGWPVMTVSVKSMDAARTLVAAYLQLDRYDSEVDEYLTYIQQ